MPTIQTMPERGTEKLRGRDRRSQNLSTKLTRDEEILVEGAASASGKTPSEWARETLLREAQAGPQKNLEQHVFTELVGVQLLLMNALAPLLRGERLSQDQLESLWKHVQITKTRKAQELLSKRTNAEER